MGEAVSPAGTSPASRALAQGPLQHPPVYRRVAHHAPLPHLRRPGLELGLDQGHHVPSGARRPRDRRQHQAQGDEGHVHRGQVDLLREIAGDQVAHVAPLQHHHPRVLAQGPGQEPLPHVHGEDPPRPALQEAIGEAPGAGPGVQGHQPGGVDPEAVEGVGQLQPPRLT